MDLEGNGFCFCWICHRNFLQSYTVGQRLAFPRGSHVTYRSRERARPHRAYAAGRGSTPTASYHANDTRRDVLEVVAVEMAIGECAGT